ncbi:MAG: type IV pilin biogenesis protein, partial [Myxococcales bacterium]|nr:type IV pilin biogenesis protein [Myxococcales bacterium]
SDDAIDGGDDENDFHSSIYLLADDHRADKAGGFDIPVNAPATSPGAHPYFMRLPLNQITRTRTVVFPDDSTEDQTRVFSKKARPLRPPMIRVTGVADGTEKVPEAEVYYVTYTIYEPGDGTCDSRWYDEDAQEWIPDLGATYEITFRLVLGDGSDPFNFQNGFTLPGDYGDGFGTGGALQGPLVSQVSDCDDGNCGAALRAPKYSPCDPNVNAPPVNGMTSIQTGASELTGFTPLEIPL